MAALHAETTGRGPRVVLVHGFTQTSACWGPVAADLSTDHEVVAVDAPGHGRSGHDGATLWDAADLLAAAGGRGTWVGYSMGGRMALHVALLRPEVVERLVLIGATPGIEDDDERAARRASDDRLADRIEAIGVQAFVDEWLALPLFAGLSRRDDCREARLTNRAGGLAASLRNVGTGAQEPQWARLAEIGVPVLWLAGADDERFDALAARAAASTPQGSHATIPSAGHTAHLEQPEAFLDVLRRWLGQAER